MWQRLLNLLPPALRKYRVRFFGADGKPISLRKWSEGTKKKFGKVLCDKCVEAEKNADQ